MIKLITDKRGQTIAVLKDDTHLSRWIEETGDLCHDGMVREKLVPLLRPGDVVVDAGAALGDHTLAYAEAVGPSGRVLAFEPNPWFFACLAVNMRDLPQVLCFNYGLSSEDQILELDLDENVGQSHLTKCAGPGRRVEDVFIRSLDETLVTTSGLSPIRFMKIDVEGHELRLLHGAARTIVRDRPLILCELNHEALLRNDTTAHHIILLMESWGYKMLFLDPSHSLELPMVDVLFTPK